MESSHSFPQVYFELLDLCLVSTVWFLRPQPEWRIQPIRGTVKCQSPTSEGTDWQLSTRLFMRVTHTTGQDSQNHLWIHRTNQSLYYKLTVIFIKEPLHNFSSLKQTLYKSMQVNTAYIRR